MTAPMLFIVTDHAERAVRGLLGLSLDAAPSWLSVVSAPDALRQIPNGAPVMSLWFSDGSLVEALWREERVRKGRVFDLDYGRHADRIADWLNRAAARESALIAEYCAERGEPLPGFILNNLPETANGTMGGLPVAAASGTAEETGRNPAYTRTGRHRTLYGSGVTGGQRAISTDGGAIAAVKGETRLADAVGVESPPSVPSPIPQKRAARWS
jgi:hypothetical protein